MPIDGLCRAIFHFISAVHRKWSPVKYRLISEISRNWSGRSLEAFKLYAQLSRDHLIPTPELTPCCCARPYDMKVNCGRHTRRVALSDPRRSGILTHASTLAITSSYKRSSPVNRGHWIFDTVLGTPPRPHRNAGAFDGESRANKELMFREWLALHSGHETCRSGHAQFDPSGFGLE